MRRSNWWFYRVELPLKNFKQGLTNLYKWLPVIWKDRDWDYNYVFNILKFKLKEMSKYNASRRWHSGWENNVRNMNICVSLTDKLNDYYESEYFDYVDQNFEFVPIEGSTSYTLESTILWDNLDEFFAKNKLSYKKVIATLDPDDSKDRITIALKICRLKHVKAKKLLFNILNDQLESWWD
jgi:predicted DNA-binding ribbon-helix-helix protein